MIHNLTAQEGQRLLSASDGLIYRDTTALADDYLEMVFNKATGVRSETELFATLVTNGTFTGNANGWTLGADWAYSANNVRVNSAGGAGTLSQAFKLEKGKTYRLIFVVGGFAAGSVTPSVGGVAGTARVANGTYVEYFYVPADSTAGVVFTPNAGAADLTVDTVSVQELCALMPKGHIIIKADDGNLADLLFSFNGSTTQGRLTAGRDISFDGMPTDNVFVKRSAAAASTYCVWAF